VKRDIKLLDRHPSWCCPGHDKFPCETYKNNRSKKARAKGIQLEHQVARQRQKRNTNKLIEEGEEDE
jgi:hypothetical protein